MKQHVNSTAHHQYSHKPQIALTLADINGYSGYNGG